jgi:phage regulator Rha-like protein
MENQMTESRQRMTSLEIAEVTGKHHKDVMKAIRNMEPAWKKICGRNFALTSRMVQQPNGGTREVPCYSLTKTECLYVATKFNDEARAKLVLRWEELEHERIARQEKMSDLEIVCRALMIQKRQIEEKDKLIEVLQPRADYCDEVLDSIDCMTMTQVAKGEGMTVHELTNLLLQKEYSYGRW